MRRALRVPVAAVLAVLAFVLARAHATGVEEFPDNGSEQEGRGGAWVARASDPLATFYNPAGLAGQPTRLTLQANISDAAHVLHAREGRERHVRATACRPGGAYPQVCNAGALLPRPAARLHLPRDRSPRPRHRASSGRAPSATSTWPEFINGTTPVAAALPAHLDATRSCSRPPSASAGRPSTGCASARASSSGTAPSLDFVNAAPGINGDAARRPRQRHPQRAEGEGTLHPRLHARRDLEPVGQPRRRRLVQVDERRSTPRATCRRSRTTSRTRSRTGTSRRSSTATRRCPNCNQPAGSPNLCGSGNNASVKVPLPMEAKLGVRYHQPRARRRVRLAPPRPDGAGRLRRRGRLHLGQRQRVRHAPDPLPRRLERQRHHPGQPGHPQLDHPPERRRPPPLPGRLRRPPRRRLQHPARPAGPSARARSSRRRRPTRSTRTSTSTAPTASASPLGGTYRVQLGPEKHQALDFMAGYGHVFFGTLSNDNPNSAGLPALVGTPCLNGNTNPQRQLHQRRPALPHRLAGQPRHHHELDQRHQRRRLVQVSERRELERRTKLSMSQ